jgi:DNA adenine methylase
MASPIVPWMGGKRRLADTLLHRFPPHSRYVSCSPAAPRCSSCAPAEVEVVNDLNGELVNLYRVVQNHLEEFIRQFKRALSSRQVFKWMQDANVDG